MIPFTDAHSHRDAEDGVLRIRALTEPAPTAGFFSLGVHPMHARSPEIPTEWNEFFLSDRCAAIGECGFDRRAELPLQDQTKLFLAHAEIAERLHKPLVVHCVRAHQELLRARRDAGTTDAPWIFHGCRGSERKIRELLEAGFILSFGEGLLRDAGQLEPFFSSIPMDSILMESDESEIPPSVLFAEAASLRKMNVLEFKENIYCNFQRIFHHA